MIDQYQNVKMKKKILIIFFDFDFLRTTFNTKNQFICCRQYEIVD